MDYYADQIGNLLQNDAIFPAQWAALHRPGLNKWQLLWLAVLSDAIHWATLAKPETTRQIREQRDALTWILAPISPRAGVGSLQFVCEALNVSAEALRERVRAGHVVRIPKHMHAAASGRHSRGMTVKATFSRESCSRMRAANVD